MNRAKKILFASALAIVAVKPAAFGCAACFGASDSPLAQGMNWGILVLLGVVGSVLFGITAFFVHLGLKSSRMNAGVPAQNPTDLNQ